MSGAYFVLDRSIGVVLREMLHPAVAIVASRIRDVNVFFSFPIYVLVFLV